MKHKLLTLLILIALAAGQKVSAQILGCMTPTLELAQISGGAWVPQSYTIPCNQGNTYIRHNPAFSYNGVGTATGSAGPCLFFQVSTTPTNAASTMTLDVYEGSSKQVSICGQTPFPCPFAITNNFPGWGLINTGLDPSQTHSFVMCHSTSNTDITYTIRSCYNNVVLASGTWSLSGPPGCQTVGISVASNSLIGKGVYTVTPNIPGFTDFGDGVAAFNPSGATPGTYTASYTFTAPTGASGTTSCSTTSTQTFIISNPYDANWTTVSPKCTADPCVALNPQVTGTSGGTWSGTGGSVSSNSFCPSVGQGTYAVNYTVGITPTCGSSNTKTITVNLTPTVSAGPTQSLTCVAIQTILVGSGGGSYSWSGPGIVSGGATANPTVNAVGVYSLTVTSAGCPSSVALVTVGQNTSTPAMTAIGNSITCVSNTVVLGANPSTGFTYTWTGPGITSGSNTPNPQANALGNYTLMVTSLSTGCTNTVFTSVGINTTAPTGVASTNGTVTCANSATVTHSQAGYNYSWTPPSSGSIVSGATSQSALVGGSGIFSLTVTDPVNGCTTNYTVAVTDDVIAPTLTLTQLPLGDLGCTAPTNTLELSGISNPSIGVTYTWSSGQNTPSISVTTPGVYDLTVINTTNGCSVTVQHTINQAPNPDADAGTEDFLPCDSTIVFLLNGTSSLSTATYSWVGPGLFSGANTANPEIKSAGVYTLTVTDPASGCTSTDTVVIFNSAVTASFTADADSGNAILNVNFNNHSIGAVNYSWTFGNGSVSTFTNPSTSYELGGTYTVTLIANLGRCTDTAMKVIKVNDVSDVIVPNVFTPNGDGVNDEFIILSIAVKDLELFIYNRWGQIVYSFSGTKAKWDGKSNNSQDVPAGTYFYIVTANGLDGAVIKKNGYVTLIR